MPIETTERAIRCIFYDIDPMSCVSEVKVAPGRQARHDRWQLMLDCDDIEKIPHSFILPSMGPEWEDLKVKVFVKGREPILENPPSFPATETFEHTDSQMKPREQEDTALKQSASNVPLPKEKSAATPAVPPPPPPHTPSARPRPTPSPNEEQPFLKRVRPQERGSPAKPDQEPASDDSYAQAQAEYEERLARRLASLERKETNVKEKKGGRRRRQDRNTDPGERKIETYFNRSPRV